MITSHLFRPSWFYKVFLTNKLINVLKTQNNLSISILNKYSINLELHRPRYASVYNNIIEDSIVDNSYYKIRISESKWKTITYKNDENKKIQEKTLFT